MIILYEDSDIIVVEKPAGIPVQTRSITQKDVVSELKNHLSVKNGNKPYIGIIHRLDQPVRGILVFALNEKAAGSLSRQIAGGGFDKRYHATVEGIIDSKNRTVLEDYLIKTGENKAKVADKSMKGARKAVLEYTVIDTDPEKHLTRLDIRLMTGRFHQIRAQLSNAGHPIKGDIKYGAVPDNDLTGGTISLCAYHLGFDHPCTGERMIFELENRTGSSDT